MYEWDETKRNTTIKKHGIDFLDMVEILEAPHLLLEARSEVEHRQIAVGCLNDQYFAVVFTMREDNYRIITARKARKDEREQYQKIFSGRDPEDEE